MLTRRRVLQALLPSLLVPWRASADFSSPWALNIVQPVNVLHPLLHRGRLRAWYLYLPGLQNGGTRLVDLIGRRVATLTNMASGGSTTSGPSKTTRRRGGFGEFSFDGTNDSIVDSTFAWAASQPITLIWSQYVQSTPAATAVSMNIGDTDNPNRCFISAPDTDSVLYWDYGNSGAGGRCTAAYTAYYAKWVRIACVSSGTANTFMGIYINGVQVGSTAASNSPGALTGLRFGNWKTLFMTGKMDNWQVYPTRLGPAEIQTEYEESLQGYPTMLNYLTGAGRASASTSALARRRGGIF